MKTFYKYIYFQKVETDNKPYFWIRNIKSDDYLGCISFYPDWKGWVFSAVDKERVFNDACLLDIISFIKQLQAF